MKLPRRKFLNLAAGAAALQAAPRVARAQGYPTRPVRIVVPFPAGGQIDIIGRVMAQWFSERLGQQFFVDNRPGAAANIGTEAVVRSAADGHTLLMATVANAVNATLFEKLNYDFIRDMVPIASVNRIPLVLEVNSSFTSRTVSELIANARTNPGTINIGTPPKGTAPFMAAQLFKMMTGLDMVHVPYRGTPQLLPDLLSGRVQVAVDGISTSLELIRTRKLRALAVTTATRLEALPDVPTVGEFVAGFEASGWCGVVAAKNTPIEIVDKLNNEVKAALLDPTIKARLAEMGVTVLMGSPADFGKLIANETEKWAKVIKFANIKPD